MAARRLVVGAAVLEGPHVLAARRTSPPAARGRWELPGGKVESGESPGEAVVREVAEELGCAVRVTGWLTGRVPVATSLDLVVATAVLVHGSPAPAEHDAVRWLGADELDDVDWLEADRGFLPQLATVLGRPREPGPGAASRVVVDDEESARAVADELDRHGHPATVHQDRLAGEDDDADHPWAVVSTGPPGLLADLAGRHDGWVDDARPDPDPRRAETRSAPSALPLPTAPRRRHRR